MAKPFRLTPPREFVPLEIDEQISLFDECNLLEHQYPELRFMHASMAGLRISIGQAVKAKRAGMRAGCPDVFLPSARGAAFGLYIELKRRKGGSASEEQKEWIKGLREAGYEAFVVRGARQAIDIIRDYLEKPKTIVIPFATEGVK